MNNVPRYYRVEVQNTGVLKLINMAYLETIISCQLSPIADTGKANTCNWKVSPNGADLDITINVWDSINHSSDVSCSVELWIVPNVTYMQSIVLPSGSSFDLFKL